jgi:hypothetical protein
MTVRPTVRIAQRSLDPHTNAVQSLTIAVTYGDGVQMEATILLRPRAIPNEESSIRREIQRLADALTSAALIPGGITS